MTGMGPEPPFRDVGKQPFKADVTPVVGGTRQRRSCFKVDQSVGRKRANVRYPRAPTFAGASRPTATSLVRS